MRSLLVVLGAALAFGQQPAQKIRVAGSVVALNGEPVRRATMRLQGQSPANYTASTGDDGKFAFEDVAPGRYTLSAEKAGFMTQRYGARSNNPLGTPLILAAGQELKELAMQLSPQGIISGHVSDMDGDPAPMVLVQLQRYVYVSGRRQLSSLAGVQTNDQGDFRIANLMPGHYYLYARDNRAVTTSASRASSQEINVQTYYPSALEPAGATALDVVAGGELRGINIQLRRGQVYAIRGKVLDASRGTSIGGIQLELDSKDTTRVASYLSGSRPADGGFEFRNLAPGTYVLRAVPGNMRGADGQRIESGFTGRMDLTIAGSSLDGVVMPVTQGFEIQGMVTLEDGDLKPLVTPPVVARSSPPSGANDRLADLQEAVLKAEAARTSANGGAPGRLIIQLSESYGGALRSQSPQTVTEDGTFRFQGLGASTYLLAVGGLPDGTYVKSVKFGGQDITRSPLELSGGGSLAMVLSSKAGSVSGALHNDKKEPLGGYLVSLWPKIPESLNPTGGVRTATTDQTGAFKFPSLAPGDYFVAAWDDLEQGLALSGEFLAHFNGDASAIKVDAGGQASVDANMIDRERIAAEVAKLP